ncbi:MAG: amidohydrolase family protein [Saprospiraceae bacterium]|nr:amidohydrolase family protein [Saprospiraceae bacterium]
MNSLIIQGGKIIGPSNILEADVLIEEGRIIRIQPDLAAPGVPRISAHSRYVLPSFVDVHHHGATGYDASFGMVQTGDQFSLDMDLMRSGLKRWSQYLYSRGTGHVLLTTMAAPVDQLLQSLGALAQVKAADPRLQKQIIGVNIEGTFLHMPAYAGAQNPAFFSEADIGILHRLQTASQGLIAMVNVPPEQGEKGIALIQEARRQNMVVAGGHTGATFDEFANAVQHGLSLAVHFFNGPSHSSYKSFSGGGAFEAMLACDEVSLELILDGYHVSPTYVRDAIARKGVENIIGITDSMFVNGMEGVDSFLLAGLHGRVSENGEYLRPIDGPEEGGLFGSVLSMDSAFSNLVTWLTTEMVGFWTPHHRALSLEKALVMAVQICASNASKKMNRPQSGVMAEGAMANLLIGTLSDKGAGYQFSCEKTFALGEEVFSL